MAHMGCSCGADMWDGDGHIVYDVFEKKDIENYIHNEKMNYTFNNLYKEYSPITEDCSYFWLCDKCKRAHLWISIPKECFRIYKVKHDMIEKNMDYIKSLNEFFVININDYCDKIADKPLKDFIIKNPLTNKKYYIENDLTLIYIIDITTNRIEQEYELEFEDYNDYDLNIETEGDNLIYMIHKTTNEPKYKYDNGIKEEIVDNDDYPIKQINYMKALESDKQGSIYIADSNKPPTIIKGFTKKYKYVYVQYEDLNNKLYCYLDNGKNVKKDDMVLVNRAGNNVRAKVIKVAEYDYKSVPYPLKNTKNIIEVIEK